MFRRFLALVMFSVSIASAQLSRVALVNTSVGTGTAGYSSAEEGALAAAARLNGPAGVALDRFGNLYVADTANNRVRRIDTKTHVITTIAGTGVAGYRAADERVQASFAQLNAPTALLVDDIGNPYIADTGNHRVRLITAATGVITTFAGADAGTSGSHSVKFSINVVD